MAIPFGYRDASRVITKVLRVKMIKRDLALLGLVTSEAKCQWETAQKMVWCGFE